MVAAAARLPKRASSPMTKSFLCSPIRLNITSYTFRGFDQANLIEFMKELKTPYLNSRLQSRISAIAGENLRWFTKCTQNLSVLRFNHAIRCEWLEQGRNHITTCAAECEASKGPRGTRTQENSGNPTSIGAGCPADGHARGYSWAAADHRAQGRPRNANRSRTCIAK